MNSLRVRLAMLLATAAVLPLFIYGVVSIMSLHEGMRRSVTEGNLNVARRAAEQIDSYVSDSENILGALAADLQNTGLDAWQRDRILKNFVLRFPEYRELTLFDDRGMAISTSRIGKPRVTLPAGALAAPDKVWIAPLTLDDDYLPMTILAVPWTRLNTNAGWLVGELNLEELWRMVDHIRVGRRGFALIATASGQLLAHGDPDEKARVVRGDGVGSDTVVAALRNAADRMTAVSEATRDGVHRLEVGVRLATLDWILIVEQPTAEAYAVATQLERQLLVVIALALLVTAIAGVFWSRTLTRPITALRRASAAIAEGHMDERVAITGGDEFATLGAAFNQMADRLVQLQEDVRKQERHAMFGRIAAGLVHDLSHPIKNIGNNCKLILKMYDDADYRETFRRTVDRELKTIKRMFEDLRNIARPVPVEHFPLDVHKSLTDVVEAMKSYAEAAGLDFVVEPAAEPIFVLGDLFALNRVYRNLILNAIQATTPGGTVRLGVERADGRVRISVTDTGCGIAPERLGTIFEDFVTTKRQGLGLGLASSRKIVEQLGGEMSVTSTVGSGTRFVIEFPAVAAPAADV